MTDGESFLDAELQDFLNNPGDGRNEPSPGSEEPNEVASADEASAGDVPKSPGGQVEQERDEYLDALRRLQAEFENYRKRMTRQQSELLDRASASLVERLLPVLDGLDLALAHAGSPEGESAVEDGSGLLGAFSQIGSLLRSTLEKEGLERIDQTGVLFDPTIHDAVSHLDADEETDGKGAMVVQVMRAGYKLKGKVLRPAMVAVQG